MWLCIPSEPGADLLKLVSVEPSPQSTSTDQSASGPGSVKEPSAKEWFSPSFELWSAAAVTLGATLVTCTATVAYPESWSAGSASCSVTVTVTV